MSGTKAAPAQADRRRRTFAPVALIGIGATGVAALAGHQPMLRVSTDDLRTLGMESMAGEGAADVGFPLAGALSLVALAAWGIVLVARGRARQVLAVVATLAVAGVLAVIIVGGFLQDDDAASAISDQLGVPGLADDLPLYSTPWFWIGLVASAVATVAAAAAAVLAPAWPEMGSRYDAPSAHEGKSSDAPPEERTSLDLWKSMDEGDDPTDDKSH